MASQRVIRKRVHRYDDYVRNIADHLLERAGIKVHSYDICVANQTCGWCQYETNQIVIALWYILQPRGNGYLTYSIAHELAHLVVGPKVDSHGIEFMNCFMKLCPPEYQYFEYDYKPRAAKAAGVLNKASFEKEICWCKLGNGHYESGCRKFEILPKIHYGKVYYYELWNDGEVIARRNTIKACKVFAEWRDVK